MNPIVRRRAILATTIGFRALLPTVDAEASSRSPSSSAVLKFRMYRGSKGRYRGQLRAANGKVIVTAGETYTAKAICHAGIDLVMKRVATASIEDET